MTTKDQIENVLWRACDTFRGKIDSSRYKDYVLTALFVKYLNDAWREKRAELEAKYPGRPERVAKALKNEPFKLDEESTFDYLYANRNDAEIGEKINVALQRIEEQNSAKLRNVFRAIDFNSQIDFGEPREKRATLRNLLEDFNELDPARVNSTLATSSATLTSI